MATTGRHCLAHSFVLYKLRFEFHEQLHNCNNNCKCLHKKYETLGKTQGFHYFFIIMLWVLMVLACAFASLRGESQALLLFPHLKMIFAFTNCYVLLRSRQRLAEEVLLAAATTKKRHWTNLRLAELFHKQLHFQ